jgi:hypothetical protein
MTQVLAALNEEGIAVATDGQASSFSPGENGRKLRVQKLFALGSHAFVLGAGLGLGVHLSRLFQEFVRQRGLVRSDDILRVAGRFFSRHYEEILSSGTFRFTGHQLDRILLLIGAALCTGTGGPYRMILLASEGGRLPFELHEIRSCITIPRSMGAEYRLQSIRGDQSSLDEVLAYAHRFLLKRAKEDEDVGPPYYWGLLTNDGLELGRWTEKKQE